MNEEDCSIKNPVASKILGSYNYKVFLILFVVINAGIALVSVVSNFVIIVTIARNLSLKTPSNILVLGLATADFITGTTSQPMYLVMRFWEIKDGDNLCMIYNVTFVITWLVSPMTLLLLTAITGDRFLAIKLHLRYQQIVTKNRAIVVLVLIFGSSCVCSITNLFINSWFKAAVILAVILIMTILLLNTYFITSIAKVILRHSRQIHIQEQSIQPNINMPRYKKTINTVYYVICAFVICYLPHLVLMVFNAISMNSSPEEGIPYFRVIASTCVFMNGALNPFIYFRRNKDLRDGARQIFGCNRQNLSVRERET